MEPITVRNVVTRLHQRFSNHNRKMNPFVVNDGAVLIAAITSCTNTSNPAVMVGAGLLAKNAAAKRS